MTATDTARTAAADSRRSAPGLFRKAMAITLGILAALALTFLISYLLLGTSGRVTVEEGVTDDVVRSAGPGEAAGEPAQAVSTSRPDPWWLTGEDCSADACILVAPRARGA